MSFLIRPIKDGEYKFCEKILRSLPEWFGIEEAILDYVKDIQSMDTRIAENNNEIVGFITIKHHTEISAELQVMAVKPKFHRQRYGSQLVEDAEKSLRNKSVEFFQVKTLAPFHPDPNYAKTRKFYEHLGFKHLEENNLWGEKNPCLIMVKYLKP